MRRSTGLLGTVALCYASAPSSTYHPEDRGCRPHTDTVATFPSPPDPPTNPARRDKRGAVRSGLGRISLVILVLAAAAACDANKPSRSGAPASTQASHAAGHTATTTVPANASPKQRCAQFEQLLGEHALVAVRVMRSVVAPAPELRPAADTALRDNTVALSQLVSAAYGRASGDRFAQPWQHHVTDLLAYARPGADGPGRRLRRRDYATA